MINYCFNVDDLIVTMLGPTTAIYFVGVDDSIGGPTNSLGFLFLDTGLKDQVSCK